MPYKRSYKRRSKGRFLSKSQTKQMTKIAKKIVNRVVEDKSYVHIRENIQLFHNIPVYIENFLGDIGQGTQTGDQTNPGSSGGVRAVRVGDEILLKNFNIKLWLSNKLDRPNVMYRGCLFWYPSTGPAVSNEMVYSTQSNKMMDRYNSKVIKVIKQFTLRSTNNYAQPVYIPVTVAGESVASVGKEKSYLTGMNKTYKNGKKVIYDFNGQVPKGWNIGLSIVCYDAFGSIQDDNIASFAYSSLITFQDA